MYPVGDSTLDFDREKILVRSVFKPAYFPKKGDSKTDPPYEIYRVCR